MASQCRQDSTVVVVAIIRRFYIRGCVVLGSIAVTLFVTQFVRQDIADLRSYSDFTDVQEIAEVDSFEQKASFEIGEICKPLGRLQQALIINISTNLDFSDDDAEILSMTNGASGIRIVVNEARQPIIYFLDPNSAPNITGFELLPMATELFTESENNFEVGQELNFTMRLFWISEGVSKGLLIQTTTGNPKAYSRLDLISNLPSSADLCGSTGSIGHVGPGNKVIATFSSAEVDAKNIGVSRNFRARAVVLALTTLTMVLVNNWVRQRSKQK